MTVLHPGTDWTGQAELELRLAQDEAELYVLRDRLRRVREESEGFHLWVGRVMESLPLGLVWSDSSGRVRSMNHAAERMLGVGREAARGHAYAELWPGHPSPADRLRAGGPRSEALDLGPDSGHLDSEVSWVRGVRGEPLGAVEILTDRTEDVRLRKELEGARSLAALGRVAAVAAHEIRNPLGGMSGFLDLLERGLEPADPRRAYAEKIRCGIHALEDLVSEFLEFTRPFEPRKDPVDLRAVVESALVQTGSLARERGVALVWKRPGAAFTRGDATRLQAAVVNVARNAVEASPRGGRVRVALIPGEAHRLTISDSGPGVDPAVRDRMFEPFITGKARGTGLGLALAAKAAQSHGGALAYRDRKPHGACFTLTLPSLPPEDA
ncbi:MAG: PAS domain-containing protein [Candidatus Eisenbacteria bacterium]|nr:PAS domain-containing protein [Candidatus Eisenbacteria bacterium]